jgi:hypothetical protein
MRPEKKTKKQPLPPTRTVRKTLNYRGTKIAGQVWWLTPVTPATWEAEIKRLTV